MLRKSRKKYFQDLVGCQSKNNSKDIWQAINCLSKKSVSKDSINPTNLTANDINSHFVNVPKTVVNVDRSNENDLRQLKEFCASKTIKSNLEISLLSVSEVYFSLIKLKQSSTRGFDDIDSKILKISAPVICDSLTYLYNLCIQKSYFPNALKQAKIIPLFKSGNKEDPCNYRPISILSPVSKLFEKHLYNSISKHIKDNDLLHPSQSGFRDKHSCHTVLTKLTDQWLSNVNSDLLTGAIFADFAKAFDVIDHSLLLRKLSVYKFSSNTLSLIQSFLSDRQQSVLLHGIQSDFLTQKYGIPQGSILGPLLFSLYINDLPLSVSSPSEMFADDTTLHTSQPDLQSVNTKLQESLNQLVNWTELNRMCLHPKKTKYMLLTSRQKRQNISSSPPSLFIQKSPVEEVSSHKVLGVIIDNNLTWSSHIDSLSKRISQKNHQLSKIKHFLNAKARSQFFHAYIQSVIDYASTLYDSSNPHTMKPLLRMHKRAVKLVLGKSSTLRPVDYSSLDILPLRDKFLYNKGITMYKIMNGLFPPSISAKFRKNQSRFTDNICIPKPRIDLFKTSLIYSGSCLWNSLPKLIKNKPSLNSFKLALKRHLFHKLNLT